MLKGIIDAIFDALGGFSTSVGNSTTTTRCLSARKNVLGTRKISFVMGPFGLKRRRQFLRVKRLRIDEEVKSVLSCIEVVSKRCYLETVQLWNGDHGS